MHPLLAKGIGTWEAPHEPFAWLMATLALVCMVPRVQRAMTTSTPRVFVVGSAVSAAALSVLYAKVYLAFTPKIIDATMYALQASWLASGKLGLPVGMLSESLRGRFLLEHDSQLFGLFPPGYPLLLAAGYVLGAPMLVGPMLAALLTWLTYSVAKEVAGAEEGTARLAALLSIACGTLRYHTADTMSHGAAALWMMLGVLALTRSERSLRYALLAGAALGMLLATRFASALPLTGYMAWKLFTTPNASSRVRRLCALLSGLTLPCALLVAYTLQVTGHVQSAQAFYYAHADMPQGCFTYGFVKHAGCTYEHGDFVRANLPDGYTLWAATKTTARRLFMHLGDAANGGPLLVALAASLRFLGRAERLVAAPLLGLVAAQVLAYAPFYFDGNYPGGGARLFADVLPIEHVLLALGGAALAKKLKTAWGAVGAASFALFAVHGAVDHVSLRDRAAPLALPEVPKGSMIFTPDDDAFNLGTARGHEQWLRLRRDDFDVHVFADAHEGQGFIFEHNTLRTFTPTRTGAYESESFWPVREVRGAAPIPVWIDGAAQGRALYAIGPADVTLGTVPREAHLSRVRARFHNAEGELRHGSKRWPFVGSSSWAMIDAQESSGGEADQSVRLHLSRGEVWVDRLVE